MHVFSSSERFLCGVLFLLPFPLYGVGSYLWADFIWQQETAFPFVAVVLIALNSLDVVLLALLFKKRLTGSGANVKLYLSGRLLEALLLLAPLLAGFFISHDFLAKIQLYCYLAAMLMIGAASVLFFNSLLRFKLIRPWVCWWAICGYALLGVGCTCDLFFQTDVNVWLAIPGGLFELFFGLGLIFFFRLLHSSPDPAQ